jgi:hypothetical protein
MAPRGQHVFANLPPNPFLAAPWPPSLPPSLYLPPHGLPHRNAATNSFMKSQNIYLSFVIPGSDKTCLRWNKGDSVRPEIAPQTKKQMIEMINRERWFARPPDRPRCMQLVPVDFVLNPNCLPGKMLGITNTGSK